MDFYAVLKSFIVLFIIVDPFGNMPIFLGLTEDLDKKERAKAFSTSAITAFSILLVFSLFGNYLLSLFNVSIDDFRIAGGLLLFIIAINLILKGTKAYEHQEEVGIVPMGCPLLAGPGAITSAIVSINIYGLNETLISLVLCFLATWLILHFSENIYSFIGKAGALILIKIMGILMATIAVSFITVGIKNIFF